MPLFHYTDLNAVVSILQHRKLWLTDLRYLNDKTEFSHGVSRLLAATTNAPHGLFCNPMFAPQAAHVVRTKMEEAGQHGVSFDPIYICSLSRAENLLSQWRGYGQYAIEFDEVLLRQQAPSMLECVYDSKIQTNLALGAITDAIQSVSHALDDHGCIGEGGYDALTRLLTLAATFKDEGFAEEREVRLVFSDDGRDTKFRVRNNILVPYVELPISLDCVKAVHIGPINERELAEISLRDFCSKIENQWQNESANIEYWLQVKSLQFRIGLYDSQVLTRSA